MWEKPQTVRWFIFKFKTYQDISYKGLTGQGIPIMEWKHQDDKFKELNITNNACPSVSYILKVAYSEIQCYGTY